MCAFESQVPFRRRIIFLQSIPNKCCHYGTKLFKLCAEGGYTSKLKVYAGQEASKYSNVSEKIVLHPVDDHSWIRGPVYTQVTVTLVFC